MHKQAGVKGDAARGSRTTTRAFKRFSCSQSLVFIFLLIFLAMLKKIATGVEEWVFMQMTDWKLRSARAWHGSRLHGVIYHKILNHRLPSKITINNNSWYLLVSWGSALTCDMPLTRAKIWIRAYVGRKFAYIIEPNPLDFIFVINYYQFPFTRQCNKPEVYIQRRTMIHK